MFYEKTERIFKKWPFGIAFSDSITKSYSDDEIERNYDRIFFENSDRFANFIGKRILYRHILEVSEDGRTIIKTPLTTPDNYPLDDMEDLYRVDNAFGELKRGEHLDVQWAPEAFRMNDDFFSPKSISMEKFRNLFLEIEDGYVFICSEVQIGENELTRENGWIVEAVQPIIKNVESGAYALRKVLGIY